MTRILWLEAGDYRLGLAPDVGGSIVCLDWRGQPVLRRGSADGILQTACFPLVPYCNRIANGRFEVGSRVVRLSPNMPGGQHRHPLHGDGWLRAWNVIEVTSTSATLRFDYNAGEWPWHYRAEQTFDLDQNGFSTALSIVNCSSDPMPCGLGFHPYFPHRQQAIYLGLHTAEWRTDREGMPVQLIAAASARDWWNDAAIATRVLDTVYAGREGALKLLWPDRRLGVELLPSDNLRYTAVYVPHDTDFFCIEPMSQPTNAINQNPGAMWTLASGHVAEVQLAIHAYSL